MTESAESLRQAALDCIAHCRESMTRGEANLTGLEQSVRDYCLSVARLPEEQRPAQEAGLKGLMQEIETLGASLVEAREAVLNELSGLGRLRQANVAYHKSDSIGTKRVPKPEED